MTRSDVYEVTGSCPDCGAPIYGPKWVRIGEPEAMAPPQGTGVKAEAVRALYSCVCLASRGQQKGKK